MDCDQVTELCSDEELLTEIRNDSGFGVCESIEAKSSASVDNGFNCESNDSVIDKAAFPMPELVPLSPQENNAHIDSSQLPQLFPIVSLQQIEEPTVNDSRRSSISSSLVDSLLDKFRRNTTESSSSECSPRKRKQTKATTSDEDLLEEINAPIEMAKPTRPNMLPTPIVKNQRIGSAFVTSDEDYERAIAKNKHKRVSEDSDRSKMTAHSQPPKMAPPRMPTHIQQPRTLAEKRALVSKNVDFLMIEQESRIFKQIQRKKSALEVNYGLLESIMDEEIPIKCGPWKALSWLRTREGNYISQYVSVDGRQFKLAGSRGNHTSKKLPPQSSLPFEKFKKTSLRSIRCCEGGRVKKKIIEHLVSSESVRKFVMEEAGDVHKRLDRNLSHQLCAITPRPLSKKVEFINRNRKLWLTDEDSAFLGDYAKFEMPEIKLQVTVGARVPLHPVAKQYLNEIIPHRDMNHNWIDFSLSALRSDAGDEGVKSFEFTVPYQNGKSHVLVREILKAKEDTERLRIFDCGDDDKDDMEWTFCKNADTNDTVEMEIVEMIKDLTNSVFVNLNDDLFTREDEGDKSAPSIVLPVKTKAALSAQAKNDKSKKMLLELRRLNANVVKADAPRVDDEEDMRRHATAHLAKDEKELRTTVIVTESDTVLLGNTDKETRRRKKLPKRYSDYLHDDAEKEEIEHEAPPMKKAKQPKELQDEPFKAKLQSQQKTSHQQQQQPSCETIYTAEELKTVKREVHKWLHVNVELRKLTHLGHIQPWCMLHNLYKCACKEQVSVRPLKASEVASEAPSRRQSVESTLPPERELSRRVLPVQLKPERTRENPFDDQRESSPKIEVVNLAELVNGGIGPIFINVYDTRENRLNQVFRSMFNNKSALAYIDGLAYFIDMRRVNVMRLKFDSIRDELEHPIFILQPKLDSSPAPAATSEYEDFVKLMFADDSGHAVAEVRDKQLLKQIGDAIESILQNVRKRIEMRFDSEPNELVREQLSMITRDRSNSGSSTASSTLTSPLHFDGKELERAPEPGANTPLMREFNKIFSIRMQRLCAIIRSNSLGLRCVEGHNNKFYLYRWDLLLRSLEEELIEVWQAKLLGESGKVYYMMAITDSPTPPEIEQALGVQNIKRLTLSNHMTELTRMILLRAENAKTKHMTILLYGCKGYFRVCGIMNSKENYFSGVVAKPTRSTHPRLTAKIQKVYNIWHGLRKIRETRVESGESEARVEEKHEMEGENIPSASDKSLRVPLMINKSLTKPSQPSSYKWFLLNVSNDFSDVFVKHWNRYLPYPAIMESIQKAKTKRQAIQLVSEKSLDWPKIFALPAAPLKFKIDEHEKMSDNFLLFGPYLRNSNSYLLLMQNVDGKMYTRDYYEKLNGIKRPSRTRCLWIYANALKCISNVDCEHITLTRDPKNTRENEEDEVESISDSDDEVQVLESSGSSQTLKISEVVGGFKEVNC